MYHATHILVVVWFSTGLVQLYIAGLPLRSCWTILCRGPSPYPFSILVAAGFEPTSLPLQCGRFTAKLFRLVNNNILSFFSTLKMHCSFAACLSHCNHNTVLNYFGVEGRVYNIISLKVSVQIMNRFLYHQHAFGVQLYISNRHWYKFEVIRPKLGL